jgi:nicotinamidase-related amidase
VVESEAVLQRLKTLVLGMGILQVPVLRVEQIPEKLGPTVKELEEVLSGVQPIWKDTFSCLGSKQFRQQLEVLDRKSVVLAGIESHVCVYQTAVDLQDEGYQVFVVADAISSRTRFNRQLGIDRMAQHGIRLTSVEMLLFELQKVAQGDGFRELIKLVK